MKNWIISGILFIVIFATSSSGAQHVVRQRLPVLQLQQATDRDSSLIHQAFRGQASKRLNENERVIDAFVATLDHEGKRVRNRNYPKAFALEDEIALLRIRVFNHKTGEGNGWMGFQRKVTRELDSLEWEVRQLKIEKR